MVVLEIVGFMLRFGSSFFVYAIGICVQFIAFCCYCYVVQICCALCTLITCVLLRHGCSLWKIVLPFFVVFSAIHPQKLSNK